MSNESEVTKGIPLYKREGKLCPKCHTGIIEKKCNGRVYVCNNPKCKICSWVLFSREEQNVL